MNNTCSKILFYIIELLFFLVWYLTQLTNVEFGCYIFLKDSHIPSPFLSEFHSTKQKNKERARRHLHGHNVNETDLTEGASSV